MGHRYYDLSASVALLEIPDCCRDLTEAVTLVDDRGYFPAGHEVVDEGQVRWARFRQASDERLAGKP